MGIWLLLVLHLAKHPCCVHALGTTISCSFNHDRIFDTCAFPQLLFFQPRSYRETSGKNHRSIRQLELGWDVCNANQCGVSHPKNRKQLLRKLYQRWFYNRRSAQTRSRAGIHLGYYHRRHSADSCSNCSASLLVRKKQIISNARYLLISTSQELHTPTLSNSRLFVCKANHTPLYPFALSMILHPVSAIEGADCLIFPQPHT